jgi:hypothetical protein
MNKHKSKITKKLVKPAFVAQKKAESITPFTISSNISSTDLSSIIISQKEPKNGKDSTFESSKAILGDVFKLDQMQPIFSVLVNDNSSIKSRQQTSFPQPIANSPRGSKQAEFLFRDLAENASQHQRESNQNSETNSISTRIPNFDETYLREQFDKADRDCDQYLELKELHEALLALYPTCKFGLNTAYFLNKKVGKTSYVKMDFTEFVNMNDYINVLQNIFVENMSIDAFIHLLKSTTDNTFSDELFESILEQLPSNERMIKSTLTNFILIVTKLNIMRSEFDCKHLNRGGDTMEMFIKKNF